MATINGDGGDNTLDDSSGDDTINAAEGNDTITVTGGSDTVDGGDGIDRLVINYLFATNGVITAVGPAPSGAEGFDGRYTDFGARQVGFSSIEHFTITTGSGADTITTASGDDVIRTNAGNDTINAGAGNDTLDGGAGNDTLNGEGGDDTLIYNGLGNDPAHGGAGFDTLVVDFSAATRRVVDNPNAGSFGFEASYWDEGSNSVAFTSIERIQIATGAFNDIITTYGGDDEIRTGAGADMVNAGTGNDVLVGGEGADTLDGGDGIDTVDYSQETGSVGIRVNLSGTAAEIGGVFLQSGQARDTHGTIDTLIGIENIKTGAGDAVVLGSDAENRIESGAGSDSLVGAGGNDTLIGGGGADFLDGGEGADTMIGGAGSDVYFVDGADDVVTELAGEGDADTVETDLDSYSLENLPNVENLFSLRRLFGAEVAGETQTLIGNSSNNTILGSEADDTIEGRAGDDRIDVAGGVNQADGGAGEDGLSFNLAGLTVGAAIDLRNPVNSGAFGTFSNFEYFALVSGSAQADTFVTTSLARPDDISLGSGDDSATVFNGDDLVNGGAGDDTLVIDYSESTSAVTTSRNPITSGSIGGFNGRYADTSGRAIGYTSIERFDITTGSGADLIVTASGDDQIRTGLGDDMITADGGNDLLDGGEGRDTMNGGAGDDIYIVDQADDVVTENSGEGTDEIRTTLSSYTLAANVEKLTYTGTGAGSLRGNASNNVINGAGAGDVIFLQDGGDDIASGGAGDDGFYFGAALTAADEVDGGAGTLDQVGLQGNYGGLTLGAKNLVGIEQLVLLPGDDTRFGDSGGNFYDYILTTVDANVAAGERLIVTANTLRVGEDLTFNGAAETDGAFLTYGGLGVDRITGGQKDDGFFFGTGGRFGPDDSVDGQGGIDQLGLQGVYTGATAVTFGADQLKGIEFIVALSGGDTRFGSNGAGYSYDLTTHDANVAKDATMVISANTLRLDETLTFDGSAETDGRFDIFSGAGADTITGGAGNDTISGGRGADVLTGGDGADTFLYASAADSTSINFDRIVGFDYRVDKIDLPTTVRNFSDAINASLNAGSFDADLAAALNGVLGVGEAAAIQVTGGDMAGRFFGVVDANGIAGYQVGEDFVVEFVDPVTPPDPTIDFLI